VCGPALVQGGQLDGQLHGQHVRGRELAGGGAWWGGGMVGVSGQVWGRVTGVGGGEGRRVPGWGVGCERNKGHVLERRGGERNKEAGEALERHVSQGGRPVRVCTEAPGFRHAPTKLFQVVPGTTCSAYVRQGTKGSTDPFSR
jgi:hypothetical protein